MYDLDVFYVSGVSVSTLLNLFRVNSLVFSLFDFLKLYWHKVQNERNVYTNLCNCLLIRFDNTQR